MKTKLNLIVFIALLVLAMLASCAPQTDEPPADNEPDPPAQSGDSPIYDLNSDLCLVLGHGVEASCTSGVYSELLGRTNVIAVTDEIEAAEHEIVIGVANRDVSQEAYRRLANMRLTDEQMQNRENYSTWLIYSDGSSVAIAFEEQLDNFSLLAALEYFEEKLIMDALYLDEGTVTRGVVDIIKKYEEKDALMLDGEWNRLADQLGEENAAIVDELKFLYSVFDDSLISWLANLYEPQICACVNVEKCQNGPNCGGAGFYFSNSARDYEGFLPDVESTNQILNFLEGSGMTDDYASTLPESMISSIVKFVKDLQAEDGYFYHPQWGTNIGIGRRGRDLNWSVSILQKTGESPYYDTANGALKGVGKPEASASALTSELRSTAVSEVSKIVAVSSVTDPVLKDRESFMKYLEDLDVRNNSYSAGNTLAAYSSTIRQRDRELREENAGYQLMDMAIEHLNDNQNPETGTWYWKDENDPNYSEYYSVNGLMKISCVYIDAWEMMPNIDKAMESAIKAITSDEEMSACVDIYNTWFAISNLFTILKNVGGADGIQQISDTRQLLLEKAPEAIRASAQKIAVFRKDDGSFSYSPKFSSSTAQGAPVCIPNTEEGDVNATKICQGTVSLIFECLGLKDVPLYTSSDYNRFISIISELDQVIKKEMEINLDIWNSDNYGIGKYKDKALGFEEGYARDLLEAGIIGSDKLDQFELDYYAARNNLSIVKTDENSKVFSFTKKMSGDPYLQFMPQAKGNCSYVFEADYCILGGTTANSDNGVFYIYFMNGENYWWDAQAGFCIIAEKDEEGKTQYSVTSDGETVVSAGKWFNLRFEIQNIGLIGSDVRMYVNNTLVQRKKTTKTISEITRMQMRFRIDSGSESQVLMDNLYFSAVEELAEDNTPLIPAVNIVETPDSEVIVGSDNRGTGVYYDGALKYTGTNATLLSMDGKLGTNSLVYDIKNTDGKNYAKISSINGDAVLELGKNASNGDPWLYVPQTEKREGSSYVFETDFVLMGGNDGRANDDNLFSLYWAQNSSDAIWWGNFAHINKVEELYYFNVPRVDKDGNALNLELNAKTWYNLRIEIKGLSSGSVVEYYLNGELVHASLVTSATSQLSHVLARFNLYNYDCKIYLDNTYFAATGDLIVDDPNEPEEPDPEIPEAKEYERGSGAYASDALTLTYANVTATTLGEAGYVRADGGASLDGTTIYAKVQSIAQDNALTIANNAWSSQGYLSIKASSVGKKYVFETDMMLDESITSVGSSRENGIIYQMYTGDTDAKSIWLLANTGVCKTTVNGKTVYTFRAGDIERAIELGEWFNLRMEFDDTTASGSSLRYYINGELIYTHALKSTTVALGYMRIWVPLQSSGTLHLDNTYFAAVVEDDSDDSENGGEGETTAPTDEDTVKNAANVLPTKTGAAGTVVLMHDDGSTASIPIIDEVFRELGLRGNIALLANKVYSDGTYNSSAIASWQSYLDTGRWQLTSHSLTHEFPGLTDDDGLITQEVVISQQILRTAFPSQRVLTYAYPGYWAQKNQYGNDRFSAIMRELVGEHYIAGRDSYGDKNIALTDTNIDWTFAPSYQFDDSNVDAIINAIKKTQNGEMAVIFTHMVAANNDTLAGNTMYEKNLRAICEAIAKLQDEGKVWVAFYEDAVLYTREAQAATVNAVSSSNSITLTLTHTLDSSIYNYPLTVRTLVPESWEAVKITQGDNVSYALVKNVSGKACVDASVVPNAENAVVTPIAASELPVDEADPKEANRGTGEHKDNALDFTGTTASGLNQDGLIGADSTINMDAFAMGAVVADINGDAGLKIGNYWNKTGYVYLNSQTNKGTNYVFETDLKFNSGSTSRSDNIVFQIYASKQKNAVSAFWPMQITIKRIDDAYYLNLYNQSIEIESSSWYNIRIEIDDITKSNSDVRYYLNGTLVYTVKSGTTTAELGSMAIWMPQTTQGVIELDNVFFGALDPSEDTPVEPETPEEPDTPVEPETPEEPDTPVEPETPEEPSDKITGRGTGVYADSALNFSDVTATALKENGKLSGTFNFDGSKAPSATVVDSNGDNAFKMYSSSNDAYVILAKTGDEYKNMVFETDLMIEAGADTWRSDMTMVQIYGQYGGTNSYWGLGTINLRCERVKDSAGNIADRKYYIACDSKNSDGGALKYEIAADSWHTLRVERKDLTASSEVNVYIDGILVHTFTSTATTTAITGMKIQTMNSGAKTVYFDNMYFGAAKEE